MKLCLKCREQRPLTDFGIQASTPDGLNRWCKSCNCALSAAWRARDPETIRVKRDLHRKSPASQKATKAWRAENVEATKTYCRRWRAKYPDKMKSATRNWVKNNPDYTRQWARRNRENNPHLRLIASVRTRLWNALNGGKQRKPTFEILGYSREEFIAHIENTFTEGMSWSNYGKGDPCWHVDHVRPIASYKPDDFASSECLLIACFALNNLEARWKIDNLRKSNKWNGHRWRHGRAISPIYDDEILSSGSLPNCEPPKLKRL